MLYIEAKFTVIHLLTLQFTEEEEEKTRKGGVRGVRGERGERGGVRDEERGNNKMERKKEERRDRDALGTYTRVQQGEVANRILVNM